MSKNIGLKCANADNPKFFFPIFIALKRMDTLFQKDTPLNRASEWFFQWVDRVPWVWALVLLALNLVLKIWNLTDMSLHLDEAAHVFHAQKPFLEILKFSVEDPNPPMYNILIGFWVKLFGVSVGSIRGFAVLFSSATVVSLFFFARKFLNIRAAVFASLLISLSSIHLYYSHDARVYPLVSFLTLLSFYVYLRILEKPNVGTFVAAVLVNAALLYTHYVPVFALFAQFLYSHIYLRKNRKGFFYYYASQIIVLVLVVPWVIYNQSNMAAGKVTDWLQKPDFGSIEYIYLQFTGGREALYFFIAAFALLGTLFLIRFFTKKASSTEKMRVLLLLMWAFVPVMVDYAVSNWVIPVFHQRYLLYTTLGAYLLLGYWIAKTRLGSGFQWLMLIGLGVVSAFFLDLNPSKHEDWKGAAKQAHEWETPRETAIIVSPDYQGTSFVYYYDRAIYEDYENFEASIADADIYLTWTDDVFERFDLSGYKEIILVATHEEVVDPKRTLFSTLNQKGCFRESAFLDGVRLYRFEMEPCERQMGFRVFLDFDDPSQWKYADRIWKTDSAWSGDYVTRINPELEFSAEYREEIGKISGEHVSLVILNFQGYALSKDPECTLVVSVEDTSGAYVYQPYYLRHRLEPGAWKDITLITEIPEIRSPSDNLLVFVWNPGKKTVFFDDLEIQVME